MFDSEDSFIFKSKDEGGKTIVQGKISGETEMDSMDDMKLEAVIALLNSVDKENFNGDGKEPNFSHYIEEIEDTLSNVKKHDRFQGEIR